MLFNSLQFLVFPAFVVSMYYALPHRSRWFLLLLASSYFYMVFVPVYILILFGVIIIDYLAAFLIARNKGFLRKLFLGLSLSANLGILCYFKYYNFFLENISLLLTNRNYLLLNETVDNNLVESSFRWMPNEQIDYIVSQINMISQYYKNLGFDKVYFTIIPNPASIIDTERMQYNFKIERIIKNYQMRADFIDVYDVFKKSKKQLYRRDDSHWNRNGLQLWVNEVNAKFLAY